MEPSALTDLSILPGGYTDPQNHCAFVVFIFVCEKYDTCNSQDSDEVVISISRVKSGHDLLRFGSHHVVFRSSLRLFAYLEEV
jgi:hypothetical protein